jgi:hypothetical protein
MARSAGLSEENAWNSVALEERLELVSKCQADGLLAALAFTFMMGACAYGFDKIYLLLGSLFGAAIIMPMFSSYSWRKGKPALILNYLAARSMARRYGYTCNISDLDVVLIFKGETKQEFLDESAQLDHMVGKGEEMEDAAEGLLPVWVCLLRGGVVLIAEHAGGAKLVYSSPIGRDMVCSPVRDEEGNPTGEISIVGIAHAKGRKVTLASRFPAAFYVFERQLQRLIAESPDPKTLVKY